LRGGAFGLTVARRLVHVVMTGLRRGTSGLYAEACPVRRRERASELAIGGNGYFQMVETHGCLGVTRRRASARPVIMTGASGRCETC
jgi:hypothetical protein